MLRNTLKNAPATTAIAALCTLVFVVTAIQARSITDVIWDSPVGESTVLFGPMVFEWGYLRTLTAGFLHLDITHLALNMFMLVLIGAEVERFVGTGPYAVAYGAGVLWSSASVLAFNFTTPTAGASGALYMLMAVLIAVAYRRSTDLKAPLTLVAVNVVYSLISESVSLWGHMGGLVVGLVMAWPLTSSSMRTRWIAAWAALVLAVPVIWGLTIPSTTPVY
ncbi:rhomboid family intramembrane serine protease [Corynebacterium lujinxingii]|uniref:Rhomboid family intramembrane serine protease n=1 Tax=Corynebacterium lujinxingii TaxID=2763010 RepID=A0A7H0JYY9_9CORY|nr:rhomboid family intramembrane serine protease [Corynebacterium lujinxingii]MBC3179236.1 rhomboid family intramembrane serine protease [Corynebacterium lujinxingii]NNO10112.1 rhomboid family intramembrane serine protease [Corynebacterium lujinxingii]QNP90255.1 rhomboid family intramembrane serine protease [Corynebacterium lujinxingii]